MSVLDAVLAESRLVKRELLEDLEAEGNELLAIAVASIRTARINGRSSNPQSAVRDPQ